VSSIKFRKERERTAGLCPSRLLVREGSYCVTSTIGKWAVFRE
jgi:hypothetical protein